MAMQRIRVKIADSLVAHPDAIAATEKTSRDEIIARAVAAYVALRIAKNHAFGDSGNQKNATGRKAARCQDLLWIPHKAKHESSIDFMSAGVNRRRLALAR
jgi:metal-responsive CopG/Arc/MetJ family transcriptional regulator